MNMYVFRGSYRWVQSPGACFDVPVKKYYNLFQYMGPVEIEVDGKIIRTRENACVIYAPMQHRWFCFPEKTAMNFVHLLADVQPLLEEYDIPLGTVFYPDDPGEIAELYRKIVRELNVNSSHREQLMDGYVRELLIKLSRSIHRDKTGEAYEKLEQLHWQILSHPEYNWTVEKMAASVSLSSSRLYALYRKQFGISPMKDVIRCRMEQAKSMLLDSLAPLPVIAERLGYSNQFHFIRQFKELTGMTPGAYRKKNQ